MFLTDDSWNGLWPCVHVTIVDLNNIILCLCENMLVAIYKKAVLAKHLKPLCCDSSLTVSHYEHTA